MKLFFFFFIIAILNLNANSVILLEQNYFDSEIGTIKNQKMVQYKKEKEFTQKAEIKLAKKVKKKRKLNPKKEAYKNIMVPVVTAVYKQLEKQFQSVNEDIKHNRNRAYIELLKKEYKVKTDQMLLYALKPHPISIVLAQGAIESAWLTSRFAKQANNIFGVWSFNKEESRIEATGSRGEKKVYLKKYKNYRSAIEDYYLSIAKSWAYKKFRFLRMHTNDPFILLPHLEKYSEKGKKYTQTLAKMIRSNEFDRYDIK